MIQKKNPTHKQKHGKVLNIGVECKSIFLKTVIERDDLTGQECSEF